MSRSVLLVLVALAACAGGGEQGQPSGVTLGDGSDGVADTDVVTTGGPAGSTSGSTSGNTTVSSLSSTATTDVDPPTGSFTGEEPSGSVGDADGSTSTGLEGESWHRYSLDTLNGTWTQVALDELWVGANAPPPTDITATVSLTHFDRLLVVSTAGIVYERTEGVWQTPEPVGRRFPGAAGMNVNAMSHTPGQSKDTFDRENVFLIETPVARLYDEFENGGVEFISLTNLMDNMDGAPQQSVETVWTIEQADPAEIGTADWWVTHIAFANGELWRFNAEFTWELSPLDNNVFFQGAAGEPDPSTVEAAYYDDALERAHFIAP